MRSEWNVSTLNEVCTVITDGSHYSPPSVEQGQYMVSVKDFAGYGFDFSKCRKISDADYYNLKRAGCTPDYDDILIGKDGARFLEDIILYRQAEAPALLSSIAIVKANKQIILPEFLFYRLFDKQFRNYIKRNFGSGSAIPRMVLKDFKRIPISFPDIGAQKHIAAVLSALDDKIELNNRINQKLEEMAQTIYKSWFVDFEPFQDGEFVESELGPIPKGYEVCTLGEIMEITSGKRPLSKISIENKDNTIPVIGASGVMAFTNQPLINEKIIVTGRVGTHGVIQRYSHPVWVSDNAFIIKSKWYEYVYQIFKHIDFCLLNRGSTQPLITQTDLKNQLILLPQISVLNAFERLSSALFAQINNQLEQTEVLSKTRDTLLPKLMSGELRVPCDTE